MSSPTHTAAIDVVIPALNEAAAIGAVIAHIPKPPVRHVIVVDNGSTDGTAEIAEHAGAMVVSEPRRGYGAACWRGILALPKDTEVVVFLDGDGSDDPTDLHALVQPILNGVADFVVGSRARGTVDKGALSPQQRAGNFIASQWLQRRFGLAASDLGPFRAIRKSTLLGLGMSDTTYGWTVEMQIKAAKANIAYDEVPVRYRQRLGHSKVSGTVRGVLGASYKILGLLAYHDVLRAWRRRSP